MIEKPTVAKILYIEDNADNRLLVRRVLEVEGYRVLEAKDAIQGIDTAKAEHPDLILMDINLPGIDGYEATRCLRASQEFQDTPILAVTANVMKGDREKTLEAGCSGYIKKPINVDLLPSEVASFLSK